MKNCQAMSVAVAMAGLASAPVIQSFSGPLKAPLKGLLKTPLVGPLKTPSKGFLKGPRTAVKVQSSLREDMSDALDEFQPEQLPAQDLPMVLNAEAEKEIVLEVSMADQGLVPILPDVEMFEPQELAANEDKVIVDRDDESLFASLEQSPDFMDPAAILDATINGSAAFTTEPVATEPSLEHTSEPTSELTSELSPALSSNASTAAVEMAAPTPPSVLKILAFTLPAIGVWLCSPVLSMIDTASVGLLSGTAQQAALNPAVSVTDYGALIVAFMYTATTNLIASAQQSDSTASDSPRTTTTLLTALQLALYVGIAFGTLLSASAPLLIRSLIGNDTLDPTVLSAAMRYVRIRCLGMPAAVVIGTAQSACLGMQDVKSPLYVLLAAALINFCGDVLLVGNNNPWLGGAAGAAWATVLSQYGALWMFWKWLTTKSNRDSSDSNHVVDITKGIMELTGTSKEGKSRRKEFKKRLGSYKHSVISSIQSKTSLKSLKTNTQPVHKRDQSRVPKSRGFLANKLSPRTFVSKPDATIQKFLPFVIPVTTTSVGRISGYIAMSHVASSTLGTLDMAAHQILFSIFCCLTPVVDALSQSAQSFVPAIFEWKDSANGERPKALSKTITNFRKCGVMFGMALVGLVMGIPLIAPWFTSDMSVLARVKEAIPGVGLFLAVNGLMCAGEGSLLGQKDLKFLRNMYAIFFFTVPAYMLRLKHRALAGLQPVGIGTMWAAFSGYNVIRTIIWHVRLMVLQRRANKETKAELS